MDDLYLHVHNIKQRAEAARSVLQTIQRTASSDANTALTANSHILGTATSTHSSASASAGRTSNNNSAHMQSILTKHPIFCRMC